MQTVIFSLDYDACTEILFDEAVERQMKVWEKNSPEEDFTEEEQRNLRDFILEQRTALEKYLMEKAKTSTKTPEVYNFSNRQSLEVDNDGAQQNKNGYCSINFNNLCKKYVWTYHPDIVIESQDVGSIKNKIFARHLKNIIEDHPDPSDKIDWYILDDDSHGHQIFANLQQYIRENAIEIPSNISMHPVKFEWYNGLLRREMFTEMPVVSGGKILEMAKAPESSLESKAESVSKKSMYESGITTFEAPKEAIVSPPVQAEEMSKSVNPSSLA